MLLLQGLKQSRQILLLYMNDAASRAVNVGDERQRKGNGHRQDRDKQASPQRAFCAIPLDNTSKHRNEDHEEERLPC